MTVNQKLLSLGLSAALVSLAGVGVAAAHATATDDAAPIVRMDRDRHQRHDCDLLDGDALLMRDRIRDHVADATQTADTARFLATDGTCLLADRPLDGTGLQYGRS